MKLITLVFAFSISIFPQLLAQNINSSDARLAAENKLLIMDKNHDYSILGTADCFKNQDKQNLFYVFDLEPTGYIVVSGKRELSPIIAYSFSSNFNNENLIQNPLKKLLIADMQARFFSIINMPRFKIEERDQEWRNLLRGNMNKKVLFQQWPPEGSTSTGGWLETNYTQSAPYNKYCPMDPVTMQRSYVGCPATAMAQILNYYEAINATTFTDEDDYYHSYAGRNYWIDDDYLEHDFLSFPQINTFLEDIVIKYDEGVTLSTDDAAALSFACGIAAYQVFSSEASGTFGVNQAMDAYTKFSFNDAILMYPDNTELFNTLSQNMIDARPAHLAVLNEAGNSGHNIVVDGYNTDDYYHVNFGWGGSYNGWYLIPDEIPYDLTVIEGVVVDIALPPINMNVFEQTKTEILVIYPNPAQKTVNITVRDNKVIKSIYLYNQLGQRIMQVIPKNNMLDISSLQNGVYILEVELDNTVLRQKVIKK